MTPAVTDTVPERPLSDHVGAAGVSSRYGPMAVAVVEAE
jgi:hypothetical protein